MLVLFIYLFALNIVPFLTQCVKIWSWKMWQNCKYMFLIFLIEYTNFQAFCFTCLYLCFSEITPEGRRITKLDQILLNGNNITMVCKYSARHTRLHVTRWTFTVWSMFSFRQLIPGGEGPEVWESSSRSFLWRINLFFSWFMALLFSGDRLFLISRGNIFVTRVLIEYLF